MNCKYCGCEIICKGCGHITTGEKIAIAFKRRQKWNGNVGRPRKLNYQEILDLKEDGFSIRSISKKLNCSRSSVLYASRIEKENKK